LVVASFFHQNHSLLGLSVGAICSSTVSCETCGQQETTTTPVPFLEIGMECDLDMTIASWCEPPDRGVICRSCASVSASCRSVQHVQDHLIFLIKEGTQITFNDHLIIGERQYDLQFVAEKIDERAAVVLQGWNTNIQPDYYVSWVRTHPSSVKFNRDIYSFQGSI
jgi:hypothetical protein